MVRKTLSIRRCAALTAAVLSLIAGGCRKPPAAPPASRPSTLPASMPVTQPTRPVVSDYPSFLRQHFPTAATSQPTGLRLPPAEAAHLRIDQPVYCDSAGELWITDPDAPPLSETLLHADKTNVHLVRETVWFVHRAIDVKGEWQPQLIVQGSGDDAIWLTGERGVPIPGGRSFAWRDAINWKESVVVASSNAVMCLTLKDTLIQQTMTFPRADGQSTLAIQLLPDVRGVLAWQACDESNAAGAGVARFVDGGWKMLTGWPSNVIQLLPLLDGGVLTIARDEKQNHSITQNYLDVASADETRINALIDQLSDPSAELREQASVELARWGASAWPILDKAQADQPPEAQVRIARLLENRTHPDLLGFRLKPGPIRVIARRGNSLMLAVTNGVTFQRESDGNPVTIAPAVLTLDGHGVRLASSTLAEAALDPSNTLEVCGDEWFASNAVLGPRWWMSNHFTEPLVRKNERSFNQVVAVDNDGRFLLRESDGGSTLLIDPSLPDQNARLPVWVRVVEKGATGWTAEDWPVLQSGGAWALTDNQWKPVDGPKVITAKRSPPASLPTSQPSLLLTDSHGVNYFTATGGMQVVRSGGRDVVWEMKTDAPLFQLFESAGHLFVYSGPGQLQRFRLPSRKEPLPTLEATFTHRLPTENIRRLWLDPAGRIDIVFDDNGLAICFPDGRIPPRFAEMMTAEDLKLANEAAEPTTLP